MKYNWKTYAVKIKVKLNKKEIALIKKCQKRYEESMEKALVDVLFDKNFLNEVMEKKLENM